jgi:hypothetical protein
MYECLLISFGVVSSVLEALFGTHTLCFIMVQKCETLEEVMFRSIMLLHTQIARDQKFFFMKVLFPLLLFVVYLQELEGRCLWKKKTGW